MPGLVTPESVECADFEEEPIEDDLLRLIFTACHPVLPYEARVALTLRLVAHVFPYAQPAALAPSPVVELNRAVAVSMADGPEAGLSVLDPLLADPAMRQYHPLPAVRADLLVKPGHTAEAKAEFERAASLTKNERARVLLLERAAAC
jgi:predicted RNA polymerase sigma factor